LTVVQELLRTVWVSCGGHELGTQGDHFFVVFAQTGNALAAAAEAQRVLASYRWADGIQLRVRMGVHTGEALLTAGRYIGLEVHRAVRIAAVGQGGQVLVSQTVVDNVAKEGQGLPGLRYLGRHRLRDLKQRELLYELLLPGQPNQLPSLRTQDAWPIVRANLVVVAALTLILLVIAGILVLYFVPTFPWALGLVAGVVAVVLVGISALSRPVQRWLASQWRAARKPFSAVTSVLLTLVLLTTLFATKPAVFFRPGMLATISPTPIVNHRTWEGRSASGYRSSMTHLPHSPLGGTHSLPLQGCGKGV
jgi:hypothetical protein